MNANFVSSSMITGGLVEDDSTVVFAGLWVFPGFLREMKNIMRDNWDRCFFVSFKIIIIIMVIFYMLFIQRAHSLFIKKSINGVNIELGKTNGIKALCMMQTIHEINKLCVD